MLSVLESSCEVDREWRVSRSAGVWTTLGVVALNFICIKIAVDGTFPQGAVSQNTRQRSRPGRSEPKHPAATEARAQ